MLTPCSTAARASSRARSWPPGESHWLERGLIETTGTGRASRTSIVLTRQGRAALDTYTEALRDLLGSPVGDGPLVLAVGEPYALVVRRDPASEIRRAGERLMTIAAKGHHTSRLQG